MKYIFSILACVYIITSSAQVDRSKLPKPSEPRPIEIGNYESFKLKNGLQVFIIQNKKLPRVSFNLILDRKPILEGEKAGYLYMMGQMMRRGTKSRTKEQIDEEIDFIGASFRISSTSFSASGLSKYKEKILELMTDILFNPVFPQEEFDKIVTQTLSELEAEKEDPDAIADNLNSALLYGSKHPFGEIQTSETTNNITIDDLKDYHKKYFVPNIAYLAIVGDIEPKESKELIKTYFKNWKKNDVIFPTFNTPQAPDKNSVAIVNRPSAVQSNISIAYPVVLKIGSEDQIKARVMNEILGGSGSAKLFMNLREDKGYTYGSYSSLRANQTIGEFNASASVRNEVTDSSIYEILYEMNQMKSGEISDEELELAKNSLAGNFSISLERPETVARFALNIARYGLPKDYYSTYLQKLQNVTKDDVQKMANKYLNTENVYINIVGKANDIIEQLKPFGDIKYYNTEGNEIDPNLLKLPEGLTAEKVINNYIDAIGGQDNIDAISSIQMKMSASIMGQTLKMKSIKMKPSKSLLEVSMDGNTVQKQIFNGKEGVASGMQGTQKITGDDAKDEAINSSLIEEIAILDNKLEIKLLNIEKIKGADAYGVEITLPSNKKSVRYYDTENGLLMRSTVVISSPQGDMVLSTDFEDYKEFNSVMFPTKIIQPMGQANMDISIDEILINTDIDSSIFDIE